MAKRPTEEDLGIAPTAEEQEILSRPPAPLEPEDDYPREIEDEVEAEIPETAEAKAVRLKDAATGKFIAKPKDAKPEPEATNKPPPGFVDNRALQEARAENKIISERMNTLLEVLNKREARAAKAEEPAPPAIPDKTVDPLGYIDYMESRLGKIEGESKAQGEARQAIERENTEFAQVQAVALPQFNEAAAADPTITPTYNALLESFAKEICYVNGIPANSAQMTPQQKDFVGAELSKLERSHIRHAVGKGMNVAEYMKNLASVRGVTVGAPVAAQASTAAPANGTAPKTIAERQAAQGRHMSIGDLPGTAAPSKINAKDLAKMSSKEFAAFAKELGDPGMDEVFSKA